MDQIPWERSAAIAPFSGYRTAKGTAGPARPAEVTTMAAIIQVWIQTQRWRSRWITVRDTGSRHPGLAHPAANTGREPEGITQCRPDNHVPTSPGAPLGYKLGHSSEPFPGIAHPITVPASTRRVNSIPRPACGQLAR